MQLKINLKLNSPCTFPINYNHIQQASVYNLLGGEEGIADFVHETGYRYDSREYRMFTFSPMEGRYSIKEKKITFDDTISFEVRSPNAVFIIKMMERINNGDLRLGYADIQGLSLEAIDKVVCGASAKIKMKAPVTVYCTEGVTGRKRYYMPDEEEFYESVADNFVRKYAAYYGGYPFGGIEILPTENHNFKKIVTFYKHVPIVGWYGTYLIEGDPAYLTFLYNTGLGSKNAQGFGMFDLIESKDRFSKMSEENDD